MKFYEKALKTFQRVQKSQINKGLDKYPEPLNPDSWTTIELIEHALQENIDQLHYLTAMLEKEKTKASICTGSKMYSDEELESKSKEELIKLYKRTLTLLDKAKEKPKDHPNEFILMPQFSPFEIEDMYAQANQNKWARDYISKPPYADLDD